MGTPRLMQMRASWVVAMAVFVLLVGVFPDVVSSDAPGSPPLPASGVAAAHSAPSPAASTPSSSPLPPPVQCRFKFNGSDTVELSQNDGGMGYPEAGVLFTVNGNRMVQVANSGNCSFINDATGALDSHCHNQFYFCQNRLCSQAFQAQPKEKTIYNFLIRHIRLNISQVFSSNVNELANGRADFCVEFRTANTVRVPLPPPPPPPPPSAPASSAPASASSSLPTPTAGGIY